MDSASHIEFPGEMGTKARRRNSNENRGHEMVAQGTSSVLPSRVRFRPLIWVPERDCISDLSAVYGYYSQNERMKHDRDSTASKYSTGISLESLLPISPPVISGIGGERFLEHLENNKYSKELKKLYHRPIRFDTSELEEGK